MIYKSRKRVFLLSILLTFIIISFLPTVCADEPTEIFAELIVGGSEIMTVFNETDIKSELYVNCRNPYNEERHLTFLFTIPLRYAYYGTGEVYGVRGDFWMPIPQNSSHMLLEKITHPFQSFEVMLRGIQYDAIISENNTYYFYYEFIGFDFPFHKIELRVPLMKDIYKFKLIEYDFAPTSEFISSGYYVMRWELYTKGAPYNYTSGTFSISYTYEFPWEDFFYNPWLLLIIGWSLGISTPKVIRMVTNRNKKKKMK